MLLTYRLFVLLFKILNVPTKESDRSLIYKIKPKEANSAKVIVWGDRQKVTITTSWS
jgi:hypothetical protein